MLIILGYVHRLIQSKSEGLVQLPQPVHRAQLSSSAVRPEGLDTRDPNAFVTATDSIVAEKVELLGVDYSNILHSQLSSQRKWYETRMAKIEHASTDYICLLLAESEDMKNAVSKMESEIAHLQKQHNIQRERMAGLQMKFDRTVAKNHELEKELRDERSLNNNLAKNQKYLTEQIDSKDARIKALEESVLDLKDQVRDLMFFLETQTKVESGDIDSSVKDGTIVGVSAPNTPKKSKSSKRK